MFFTFLVAALIVFASSVTHAVSGQGLTGRTNKAAGTPGCAGGGCHLDQAQDLSMTVSITGPSSLYPGQVGRYTVTGRRATLTGQRMGVNIAASDSDAGAVRLAPVSSNLVAVGGELVHSTFGATVALATTDGAGQASYTFDYTMSSSAIDGGTRTLYAVARIKFDGSWRHASNFVVNVAKLDQSITFGLLPDKVLPLSSFSLSPLASASSGLPISYSSTTGTVCTISGTTVSVLSIGTCTIRAEQGGNTIYRAASPVSQSFTISKGSQTITFGAQADRLLPTAPFALNPPASTSSGLAISYSSGTGAVCTVSGTTVTAIAAGLCTIHADQGGNANYNPAPRVSQSFTIARGPQSISFGAQSPRTILEASFPIAPLAIASSGLAVSYSTLSAGICSISGTTVTVLGLGTCVIDANQGGDANYNAAPQVSQAVNITKASQSISFPVQPSQVFVAGGSFAINPPAVASSGLPVVYSSLTSGACSVAGSTVTMLSAGTCTIAANQAGNASYAAAVQAAQSIVLVGVARGLTISTYAGGGVLAPDGNPAIDSAIGVPFGSTISFDGLLYFADSSDQRVYRVTDKGAIEIVVPSAGKPSMPAFVAFADKSTLLMSDEGRHYVLTPPSTAFAGVPDKPGFRGDGTADRGGWLFDRPQGIALGAKSTIFIADTGNARVRFISPAGVLDTLAGGGTGGLEGTAAKAALGAPAGVATDSTGTVVYFSDSVLHRILKVTKGVISVVAGSGVQGYKGDGGLAVNAELNTPLGLDVDDAGNIYFADSGNHRIRKISPSGVITTVAGNGIRGFAGDGGSALSASLSTPRAVTVDDLGNLFISDSGNARIRKVTRAREAKFADLSGDAFADLLIQNDNGTVLSYLMNGTTVGASAQLFGPGTGWSVSHIADLNGDSKADLVLRNTDGAIFVYIMDGLNVTGGALLFGGGSGWSVSHTADLDGDGRSDLVLKHTDGSIYVYMMEGATVTGGGFILGAGTGWSVSHAADLNGDGKADLVLRNVDGSIFVYTMNGATVTGGGLILGAASGWTVTHTGDLNDDGKADLVLRNVDGSLFAYLMNGATVTGGGFVLGAGTNWSPALMGDMNGDGKADLVLQNTDGSSYIYLMNGAAVTGGGFVQNPTSPYRVTHLFDYNGDGKSDIILRHAGVGDGTTVIFLMDGATLTAAAVLLGAGGGWTVSPPQLQ